MEEDLRAGAVWPWWKVAAVRVVGVYLALYALCCSNATVWEGVPFAAYRLEGAAAMPFHHAAQWVGVHWLHLTGLAANLHGTGYNDRALDYVGAALMFVVAVVVGLVWTAGSRGGPPTSQNRDVGHPDSLGSEYAWLRWLLRMTLAVSMLIYGLWKMAPLQIHSPLLAVLNEPVGQTSPMSLFWATVGVSPWYTRITGFAELACAALLFYRRTALAGTLLTVVVMSNVLLFDLFFDVPVKLYSAHLLVMCAVVMWPDLRAMGSFFWRHEAAATTVAWAPGFASRRAACVLIAVEVMLGVTVLQLKGVANWRYYESARELRAHPSPLMGQWHVESGSLTVVDGAALVDVFFEPDGFVVERGANGRLWGAGMYARETTQIDLPTEPLGCPNCRFYKTFSRYQVELGGADRLRLVSGVDSVNLLRVELPKAYPLLEAQPHWVNEYPVER